MLAQEQLPLALGQEMEKLPVVEKSLHMEAGAGQIAVFSGQDTYRFCIDKAGLCGIESAGVQLLTAPFALNLWRAPTDNDRGFGANIAKAWSTYGLDKMQARVTAFEGRKDGEELVVTVESVHGPAVFRPLVKLRQVFRFDQYGGAGLEVTYTPFSWQNEHLAQPKQLDFYLPRLGLRFQMPRSFDRLAWYGQGPHELP